MSSEIIETVVGLLAAFVGAFVAIKTEVSKLTQEMTDMRKELKNLDARVSKIESGQVDRSNVMATIMGKIDDLQRTILQR